MDKKNNYKENNYLVTKSNKLISGLRAKMSLQQQRLLALMICQISPDDKEFKEYVFTVKDFCYMIGVKGRNYYLELQKITEKLLRYVIKIQEEDGSILQTSWLSAAYYREGEVYLSFHPRLKPYLLELKQCFTTIELHYYFVLQSMYAMRIYEICKQYQNLNRIEFTREELRKILGIEQDELLKWSNFKNKVLNIAQREINEKTDLEIHYHFRKVGRKIEYIIINIKMKNNKKELKQNDEIFNLIPEKYRQYKTIKREIMKYIKNKGIEYVKRNIEYANKNANKNYRAFLIKALKEDWALNAIEDQKVKEQNKIEQEKRIEEKFSKLDQKSLEILVSQGNKKAKEILQKLRGNLCNTKSNLI